MLSSLLFAFALLTSSVSGASLKVHLHSNHMKFREVEVIEDNAPCPNGGSVLLCQSPSYACQDDGTGAQKCLPRDESFLDSVDNSFTMPWSACSQSNASLPSNCLFDFQCICMDVLNVDCYCYPPDALRTKRDVISSCSTSSGKEGYCDPGKYCRSKKDKQECATAPYFVNSTSLYSDCTTDKKCDAGLTCKIYDKFGICVKDDKAEDDKAEDDKAEDDKAEDDKAEDDKAEDDSA